VDHPQPRLGRRHAVEDLSRAVGRAVVDDVDLQVVVVEGEDRA